ncbi:hypothetical protein [Calothrix sp. NIES-2098]|uniref:hypothetical protein n=1 Tax=Calothrix sp. NIES-2098 TaxID=1954171 RepID=UPI000B5EBF34|nr:VWA containing CoxE family protein [Calothrix sp. NIES-2098]
MEANELPLLDLFNQLREAGLPLGINEYQLLLKALQAGFGITDQNALKRLCQTLWIKSPEEMHLFNYHFQKVMANANIPIPSQTPTIPSSEDSQQVTGDRKQRQIAQMSRYAVLGILEVGIILGITSTVKEEKDASDGTINPTPTPTVNVGGNPIDPIVSSLLFIVVVLSAGYGFLRWLTKLNPQNRSSSAATSLPKSIKDKNPSTTSPSLTQQMKDELLVATRPDSVPEQIPSQTTPAELLPLTQNLPDEVHIAQLVQQATSIDNEMRSDRFMLATDYLPVTHRQMKQSWRYLRRRVREGSPTELDIEATINQIGRQRFFLELVFQPRYVNKSEVLLLIDRDGSMVPFHMLSQRLKETALQGGRLGSAEIYYFHNCPVEYLYHDPSHLEAKLINEIIGNLPSAQTGVLIFSDAGSARGGFNPERIELTIQFLNQLKRKVRYIAWLNPVPKARWSGTTAGKIADYVPMFEISRRGLQNTIDVLRGRFKYSKG